MLQPSLKKNDKKAKLFIYTVSFIVFAAVVFLSKYKLEADFGFDVHVFAKANAIINSLVAALLLAGLFTVKNYVISNHAVGFVFSLIYCSSFAGGRYKIWRY